MKFEELEDLMIQHQVYAETKSGWKYGCLEVGQRYEITTDCIAEGWNEICTIGTQLLKLGSTLPEMVDPESYETDSYSEVLVRLNALVSDLVEAHDSLDHVPDDYRYARTEAGTLVIVPADFRLDHIDLAYVGKAVDILHGGGRLPKQTAVKLRKIFKG